MRGQIPIRESAVSDNEADEMEERLRGLDYIEKCPLEEVDPRATFRRSYEASKG